MGKLPLRVSIFVWIFFIMAPYSHSQTGSISGYMFGDYYYMAQSFDSDLEGQNGFWFRRIYFTYDDKLGEEFAIRFRMELSNSGDFSSGSKLEPILKDGYLKWTRSQHTIILGMSPTPSFNYLEGFWGYRSIEKTAADLYKLASSRDLGVAIRGTLDAAKRTHYHFMFANGSSTGSETNKGKKFMLAVGNEFESGASVEVYGDWESRPGETNRYSAQVFFGVQKEKYRLGIQYLHQTRQQVGNDEQLQVLSVFGSKEMNQKLWGFFRFDHSFDPISDGPGISYFPFVGSSKFNFIVAGVDYSPHSQVHFMPNVEFAFYDEVNGVRPDASIMPRLTFHYIWK